MATQHAFINIPPKRLLLEEAFDEQIELPLLMEWLMSKGLTQIEATQQIRAWLDGGQLFQEDCFKTGCIELTKTKETTLFERRQKKLQEMWLHAKSLHSHCAAEEDREIEKATILLPEVKDLTNRGRGQRGPCKEKRSKEVQQAY